MAGENQGSGSSGSSSTGCSRCCCFCRVFPYSAFIRISNNYDRIQYLFGKGHLTVLEMRWTVTADGFVNVDSGGGNEGEKRQNEDRVFAVQLVGVAVCASQLDMSYVVKQTQQFIHFFR